VSLECKDGKWWWYDEVWGEHGPCSSRDSAVRRQMLYFNHIGGLSPRHASRKSRDAALDAECECVVHPCDEHFAWDCQCAGACSCHWLTDRAEEVARSFHEAYEALAPNFAYETRATSAKPWAEIPENNRALMVAVVRRLLGEGVIR